MLTQEGLNLVCEASKTIDQIHDSQINSLTEQEAITLNELLDKMRA
jgi:hypothetical protein